MDTLCCQITQAFGDLGPSVRQVLVLLVATSLSAKEVYCFHFPTKFFDGKILTAHRCTSRLFRKLISSDFTCTLGALSSTKLRVFLNAPRDCVTATEGLEPKLNFQIPGKRAKRLDVHLDCSAPVSSPELSYCEDCDMDISGIDFLLATPNPPKSALFCNKTNGAISYTECATPKYQEMKDDKSLTLCQHSQSKEGSDCERYDETVDNIWYQIPVTVTGLKDKASDSAKKSSESIFMT